MKPIPTMNLFALPLAITFFAAAPDTTQADQVRSRRGHEWRRPSGELLGKTVVLGLARIGSFASVHADEVLSPLFPFLISYDEPDNASSMAHLLDAPAGKQGFIRVENGRFFNDAGQYGAEGPLMLRAYGALQDWDGVFEYTYNHSPDFQSRRELDHVTVETGLARWDSVPTIGFDVGWDSVPTAASSALSFRSQTPFPLSLGKAS